MYEDNLVFYQISFNSTHIKPVHKAADVRQQIYGTQEKMKNTYRGFQHKSFWDIVDFAKNLHLLKDRKKIMNTDFK
jgi:uncharacterized protein (DUF2461 family)